jgi:hypothetical protein
LGTQRGTCDQGNEQAQRSDDRDGQRPSSSRTSAPRIHGGTTIRQKTWVATPTSCENDQSSVCVAPDGPLAGLRPNRTDARNSQGLREELASGVAQPNDARNGSSAKKVLKNVRLAPGASSYLRQRPNPGRAPHRKKHVMSTMHDMDLTAFAPRGEDPTRRRDLQPRPGRWFPGRPPTPAPQPTATPPPPRGSTGAHHPVIQ